MARVLLEETFQLVQFDPTLLSCAKKRGVEPPRRNCPEETLERVSSGLLRKQRGAAPLPPPRSCPARKTSNGAPSCLPSGEGGLAKRGRMRVGEQYQAALPYRWCFKTLIRLPLVGTFPGGEGFGACVPARCCTQTSDTNYARPARIFAEQKCLAADKSSKFAARQEDRQTFYKPVKPCIPERECFQNT